MIGNRMKNEEAYRKQYAKVLAEMCASFQRKKPKLISREATMIKQAFSQLDKTI